MEQDSINDWYTAAKAAEVLSRKSGRVVKPEYLRSLARLGKITTRKIGERTMLYLKSEVDAYIVEPRGSKSARAKKAQARREKQTA